MFDLGDEFMIESFRVPWLIWVQLLVMILLLIVLFFGFGIFALDLSDDPNCSSASSVSSSGKKALFNAINCSNSSKLVGVKESNDRKTMNPACMSKGEAEEEEEEESMEMNESSSTPSAKDIALHRLFGQANHPCNYFDLVKEAFLKCFGLVYDSDSSSNKKRYGAGRAKKD